MAEADNLHSQMVGWAKLLLPLGALVLLSTLFLFARDSDESQAIPFAEIAELARDQRITAPAFSGVTGDGTTVLVGAATAQAMDGDVSRLRIDAPRLTLEAPNGTVLHVRAGEGTLNADDRDATLTGLVRLETSNGYIMETEGLDADLARGAVASHGRLAIMAPFGEITAGSATIRWAESGAGQRMDFADGVKLVYQPPEEM